MYFAFFSEHNEKPYYTRRYNWLQCHNGIFPIVPFIGDGKSPLTYYATNLVHKKKTDLFIHSDYLFSDR